MTIRPAPPGRTLLQGPRKDDARARRDSETQAAGARWPCLYSCATQSESPRCSSPLCLICKLGLHLAGLLGGERAQPTVRSKMHRNAGSPYLEREPHFHRHLDKFAPTKLVDKTLKLRQGAARFYWNPEAGDGQEGAPRVQFLASPVTSYTLFLSVT